MRNILIVVDVQNIFFAARNIYGKGVKIEFGKLLEYFKQECPKDYDIQEAYKMAFVVSTNLPDSRNFRTAIQKKYGFTVLSKTVSADKVVNGPDDPGTDWDVGLALKTADLMLRVDTSKTLCPYVYDILILVSGDGDFVDLIKFLKEHRPGVVVEAASFRSSMSHFLIKMVDHFYELEESVVRLPENRIG